MPSYHLILCRPLLLLPSVFPNIRVFSSESALWIRWPTSWGSSYNISPSSEHLGLISFRMDWWDLLVVQGTLKSLLQHHSSKASILRCSAFFIVQLLHPYRINAFEVKFNWIVPWLSCNIRVLKSFMPQPRYSYYLLSILCVRNCSKCFIYVIKGSVNPYSSKTGLILLKIS